MIFKPEEMIGIIDLRSLGYYKIKQGILQQNLSRYYRFENTEKLCEYFNKFMNILKREREQKSPNDNYPQLDPDDDRRHMTDREILEKYINLNNSCLSKEEKTKVMDMLLKYKEAFSLRDEIGTCPNIEVEIDVTDKSPFFIRPYHIREEDKAFCCIIFFCPLTGVAVIVLLEAVEEAMTNNRELSRIFHHIISSDLKVIVC